MTSTWNAVMNVAQSTVTSAASWLTSTPDRVHMPGKNKRSRREQCVEADDDAFEDDARDVVEWSACMQMHLLPCRVQDIAMHWRLVGGHTIPAVPVRCTRMSACCLCLTCTMLVCMPCCTAARISAGPLPPSVRAQRLQHRQRQTQMGTTLPLMKATMATRRTFDTHACIHWHCSSMVRAAKSMRWLDV